MCDPESTTAVHVELDVPARMRDGVVLRADVYRPAGDGPWPTIVIRTPYGKGVMFENTWNGLSGVEAARRGFMVVIQDVRGRYASDGEWHPLHHEGEDGADTIAWAAELRGSNGRVGMWGGSYCGHTQLRAALEQPPALAAITPLMTWFEPRAGLVSRGGAIELSTAGTWPLIQGFDWLFRIGLPPDQAMARAGALIEDIDKLPDEGYWGLPAGNLPVLERHGTPGFVQLSAADDVQATDRVRIAGRQERIEVPSLHTGGWFDVFTQGTIDNYMAMKALGRDARLIIGPWTHMDMLDTVGERPFGVMSMREAPAHPHGDWSDELLAFLGRHLADDGAPADDGPPVRLFVMGRNEWRDEEAWPLERAEKERWHLHAGGTLDTEMPAGGAAPSEIEYDPADPVPTRGGAHLMALGGRGPVDQASIEARDDVLVFTSSVLEEDLEVTGRVRARLYVESSAPSTDWVARLCDVTPDGRSFNVCDGIVRIKEAADTRAEVEVDLWSTSNVFLSGHRVRLQITNSCFPRWDRNLNTGEPLGTDMVTAHQRLYHDAERPSHVELPVVRT